jgi:hypothetical protein
MDGPLNSLEHVVVCLAGTITQERATNSTVLPQDGDERTARAILHRLYPGIHARVQRDDAWIDCSREARQLVDAHLGTITDVADELYEFGELSGQRLADLLR